MPKLKIDVIGMERVNAKLNKLTKAQRDLTPALNEISPLIVQDFKANFNSAGQVLESPWVPRKKSYPWPILQKKKIMKNAWKEKIKKQDIEITNTAKYAQWHHFGSLHLPVRKLVGKTQKIVKMAMDRIEKYFRTIITS